MSPLCKRRLSAGRVASAATAAGVYVITQPYLLLPEHISLGDAVQQRVGNLASSAGHHNTDRFSLDRNKQALLV